MMVDVTWTPVQKSKFHGASSTPSKRRLLDGVATEHPTHWLICAQVDALEHRDSTAAHLAARQGFTDVVELLATHPRAIGNMALKDYDGRTPADVAYAAGHTTCGDAIAKLTTDALGMRLRKWAAKEAERMLFATKRYSILYLSLIHI